MPNWCEGSLRIRGKYEDVARFFNEGINAYTRARTIENPNNWDTVKVERAKWFKLEKVSDEYTYINFDNLEGNHAWIYIEDTKRAFVNEEIDSITVLTHNDVSTVAFAIKQAWGFEEDNWTDISLKYHLELKLYGIEAGMGFFEDLYIKDGKVVSDNSYAPPKNGTYDDFVWNCPFPWMGG